MLGGGTSQVVVEMGEEDEEETSQGGSRGPLGRGVRSRNGEERREVRGAVCVGG